MDLIVRVFHILEPYLVAEAADDDIWRFNAVTKRLVKECMEAYEGGESDETFMCSGIEVNDRAQLNADKWIEDTAIHLQLYSSATMRPSMNVPQSMTGNPSILQTKSFSGDVSGVIGETLFSLLLVKLYAFTDEDFAHFRATKSSGLNPDFGIYRLASRFQEALQNKMLRESVTLPIPCEVKTVTRVDNANLGDRIYKAVSQINAYWKRQPNSKSGTSMICVAMRNPEIGSYDLALIWGK